MIAISEDGNSSKNKVKMRNGSENLTINYEMVPVSIETCKGKNTLGNDIGMSSNDVNSIGIKNNLQPSPELESLQPLPITGISNDINFVIYLRKYFTNGLFNIDNQ